MGGSVALPDLSFPASFSWMKDGSKTGLARPEGIRDEPGGVPAWGIAGEPYSALLASRWIDLSGHGIEEDALIPFMSRIKHVRQPSCDFVERSEYRPAEVPLDHIFSSPSGRILAVDTSPKPHV